MCTYSNAADRLRGLPDEVGDPAFQRRECLACISLTVLLVSRLTEIGIEEGSQPPTCFPVWGPQGIPAAIVTVKVQQRYSFRSRMYPYSFPRLQTSMGPSVKKRVETHVLRVEQSGVPSVATILSTIMRRVQSRQESLNTSARLKFLQSGLPEVVAAHALQSMGAYARCRGAHQTSAQSTSQVPLRQSHELHKQS